MGKFYASIGYSETKEDEPGVWVEHIEERKYYGDVLKNASKWRDGETLNSNLILDNRLSIVADQFAYANFHRIRCIKWMGVWWKVVHAEVQHPRIILVLGGVYNEQASPSRAP